MDGVVCAFDHKKAVPPEAVSAIDVVAQVKTVMFGTVEIAATGMLASCVIVTCAVPVQPFAAVTVTVKVPAEPTETIALEPKPFDQA